MASRVIVAALCATPWIAACRDLPAPEGGVHAISSLRLPSPGVVAGDTIRDSTGAAVPLSLIAYGADNEALDPPPPQTFVVLDTGAHIENAVYLIGDTPGTTVRVLGSVASLQTQPVPVKVTLRPDTLVPADSTFHRVIYTFPPDTAAQATLTVTVQHFGADTTGVEAVVVRYTVDRAPTGNSAPTVVLLNGSIVSDRDTTEATGRASRVARLRVGALTSFVADTVLVTAHASHRGASLGAVEFTLIFRNSTAP
jgi:hypothetical protein